MFTTSQLGALPWLSQLTGHRFRYTRGTRTAKAQQQELQQICNVCQDSLSRLGKEEWAKVLEGIPVNRLMRKRELAVKLDGKSTLVLHPASSRIYIQTRGFRARSTQGFGRSGKTEREENQGFLGNIFAELRKGQKKPENLSAAELEEKYQSYKTEVGKMAEPQKKVFTDGYVKGLLTAKPGETTATPKKPFPITLIITFFILIFLLSSVRVGGDRQLRSLFFTSAQEVKPEEVSVTFDDVRGMDEAKKEVEEIVNYLQDPDKYSRLGGRLPKGVLLVGPPGTGKTLLARAIAGEADVPFFHTSGSEFDEVLVGQGARRVRDLFERAKAKAPCIIFIDEIDSVGSKRVSNGLHPYANQTINQLLSEMDGFTRNEGVIVIGATNRIEDLDKALLRPGRFDVRVTVPTPDLEGRKDIFSLYLSRIIHEKLNIEPLAKGTTGFTGADIENMVNQAALKAATEGCSRVLTRHLEDAKDRILMGPARMKGRLPDEETNKNTAYHEAGHTLVALHTKDATPLHKVTIIPRGQSGGHTAFLPEKDQYQVTRAQLLAQLDVAMGGRVAEELVFGNDKVTTGASSDLKRATALAREMVEVFGFSDRLGLRDFTVDRDTNTVINVNERGPQTNELIDQEISRLLQESYERAKNILTKYKKEHQLLAEALLEHETLTADEVRSVVNGGKIERLTVKPLPTNVVFGSKRRDKRPAIVQVQVNEVE
ncbi:ATP-dependent zinc metalloprotease YME1 isoform X1 [Aphelenchoides avenae]|nr:ATP-dependent zinc metalloprotease YME1 isoform X1 [Aphelenchus avenae]